MPLDYKWPFKDGELTRKTSRISALLLAAYSKVFYTTPRLSGIYPAILQNVPGQIDHLWGCDMAFRKEIFRGHHFDERMQKYGGYALWEDLLFTHQLHGEGLQLCIAEKGLVTHRAAPGGRIENQFNKGRIDGYNASIVWKKSIFPFAPWSVIPFLWARIGFFGVVLLPCLARPWQKMR